MKKRKLKEDIDNLIEAMQRNTEWQEKCLNTIQDIVDNADATLVVSSVDDPTDITEIEGDTDFGKGIRAGLIIAKDMFEDMPATIAEKE